MRVPPVPTLSDDAKLILLSTAKAKPTKYIESQASAVSASKFTTTAISASKMTHAPRPVGTRHYKSSLPSNSYIVFPATPTSKGSNSHTMVTG